MQLENKTEFIVTSTHLKLLKNMHVDWVDTECGAHCIRQRIQGD